MRGGGGYLCAPTRFYQHRLIKGPIFLSKCIVDPLRKYIFFYVSRTIIRSLSHNLWDLGDIIKQV